MYISEHFGKITQGNAISIVGTIMTLEFSSEEGSRWKTKRESRTEYSEKKREKKGVTSWKPEGKFFTLQEYPF